MKVLKLRRIISFCLKRNKIFIGGFGTKLQVKQLTTYFEKFGKVKAISLIRDNKTGISKGFGFLKMQDSSAFNQILVQKEHFIEGVFIDIQLPNNRPNSNYKKISMSSERTIFIGGLANETTAEDIKSAFEKFGEIADLTFRFYDSKVAKKSNRGFGFITFEDNATVKNLLKNRPEVYVLKDRIFYNEIKEQATSDETKETVKDLPLKLTEESKKQVIGPVFPFRKPKLFELFSPL